MRNKQSGFFIAGGLEFLVLAALVGGYAATDQYMVNTEKQSAEQTAQVQPATLEPVEMNDIRIADR